VRRAAGWASRAAIQARIDFYGGLCWICRAAPYEAIDHVKPISRGGSKWPANLRPACTPCNSRKGAQWPYEVRFVA
jgi:5-methylcytosine-specific restriction endonuclease McrA